MIRPISDDVILRFLSGLWQLNRRMKQDLQPLLEQEYGLDLRRYFILITVRKGKVYPKEIAQQLDFPSTLLSRYLDQLVTQGYVQRQVDAQDSRRIQLLLTPSGEDAIAGCLARIKSLTNHRLSHLDPEQLDTLLAGIELLSQIDPQENA